MRTTVVLLSFAACLAGACPALGQPKKPPAHVDPRLAEAKRLFEDGAAAYAQGSYDAAIKAWEQSYEISQKPLIFESIANAWERLGDARKARDALSKWRAYAPMEERDLLDARIRNLDARVAREDEAARQAAAGKAAAEAAAAAQIQQGQARPWLLGAVTAGAGGVLVIGGVVLDAVAKASRPSASLCTTSNGQTLCQAAAQGPINTSDHLALAGDILWAVGAAAVAAGVTLVFLRRAPPARTDVAPPPGAPPPAAAPAAWVSPAPGGLMLGGRF
jgi:tetratricopeptide (TPR) repeat protein